MAGLSGDDIGELLKLAANIILLVSWFWHHRPR
jgi:hypothetical protein